ncbi:MAG: DUF1186 family protein [Treponema sp.]|nr:DUF1186 family protein [Treponema sp.]
MLNGFSDEQIVSFLGMHNIWGKRACREILKRKDDFIPLLLGVLDQVITNPDQFSCIKNSQHIPAAVLLSQMRVGGAYRRLISLLSFDDKTIEQLWRYFLVPLYPFFLRDTYSGEAFLLFNLLENRSVSPLSRSMAVNALSMHYLDGHVSRDEIAGCFRHLIRDVYTGELDNGVELIIGSVVARLRDYHFAELTDDVRDLYQRSDFFQKTFGNIEELITELNSPGIFSNEEHLDDTIQILEIWSWFNEEEYLIKLDILDDPHTYEKNSSSY